MITKQEALSKLPKIEDKQLYIAVKIALWLLIEKTRLRHAIDTSAQKHQSKPKSNIEKLVVPHTFFNVRKTIRATHHRWY